MFDKQEGVYDIAETIDRLSLVICVVYFAKSDTACAYSIFLKFNQHQESNILLP